jgi:hypothetical protein
MDGPEFVLQPLQSKIAERRFLGNRSPAAFGISKWNQQGGLATTKDVLARDANSRAGSFLFSGRSLTGQWLADFAGIAGAINELSKMNPAYASSIIDEEGRSAAALAGRWPLMGSTG